jgi:TRAP-type C4-dicarboxylate transport system substrate-binding protein
MCGLTGFFIFLSNGLKDQITKGGNKMATQKHRFIFLVSLLLTGFIIAYPCFSMAQSKVFKWRMQTYEQEGMETYKDSARMAEAIDQRTGGALKITVHPPGILGYASNEVHRPVSQGLLEIGESSAPSMQEQPVYLIFDQPIFENLEQVQKGYIAIRDNLEAAAGKMNCKLLRVYGKPVSYWLLKAPLAMAKDWKGQKVRAWSPVLATWLKEMGASPQVVPIAETYSALATGVIAGDSKSPLSVIEMKLYEVGRYYCLWPNLPWVSVTVMNLNAFSALPPEIQKIVVEEGAKSEERSWKFQFESIDRAFAEMKERGMTIIKPTQEEIEVGAKIYRSYVEAWAKKQTPETNAALERVRRAIAGK